jgi:hypothetical protein
MSVKAGSKRCPPHYFLVDTPAGPTSDGRCKKCGEVRTFCNTNPERLQDMVMRARIGCAAKAQWARFRAERDAHRDAEADGESRG